MGCGTARHAEYLTSFSPAGVARFFAEVAPRVVPGEPAPAPSQARSRGVSRGSPRVTGSRSWSPPPTLDLAGCHEDASGSRRAAADICVAVAPTTMGRLRGLERVKQGAEARVCRVQQSAHRTTATDDPSAVLR